MKINILYLLSFPLVISSCTQSPQEIDAELQKQKRTETLDHIHKLEQDLGSMETLDMVKGNRLVEAYEEYANAFRQDSITPYLLFKGADLAIGVHRYQDAIKFYERIYKYYTEFPKRVDALFMQAFVYDEHMKMKGKASDLYSIMIEKYPDHPLTKDAKALRQNLTLSDEELIRQFNENNQKQLTP